jgi:DUF971 family protein
MRPEQCHINFFDSHLTVYCLLLTDQRDDGKECRYPFAGLRAVCPCAECQGGHENMGRPADKEVLYSSEDPQLNMESLEQVGSYAITIHWNDGHWHGIYTWKYLYEACI